MTYYVGANVAISPDVAIAHGVVLEAAPNSHLIVESGVCIGAGAVIQVFGGNLTLAAGANLGQEVLLVGAGIVGARACIGAESTLINPQVQEDAVIPARSLLGHPIPGEPSRDIPNDSQPISAESNGALVPNGVVYGREQVMQLVQTLFPYRDRLNSNSNSA